MAGRDQAPDDGGEAEPGAHGPGEPGNGWGERPVGSGSATDWGDDFAVDDDGRPVPVAPATQPWWMVRTGWGGAFGQAPQLSEPTASTPLDVETEGVVPTPVLWAMKYLRHAQFTSVSSDDPDFVRWGSLDDALYVIEDGGSHCMVARPVGAAPDGCLYCLVGRVKRLDFEDVRADRMTPPDLFSAARELTLCSVVAGSVSNVAEVERYRRVRDVPPEYLPPSPFLEFDRTL